MGNGWVVVVVVVGGEVTKIEQVRTRGKGEGAQILVILWERNNWKPPRHHAFRQATPFFENWMCI